MFRRRRDPAPEPQAAAAPVRTTEGIPPRLAPIAQRAIEAEQRWQGLVASLAAGPIAERLTELGEQVSAGVAEILATGRRAGEIERVAASLDVDGATAAFKAAKRQAAQGNPPPELEAVEARFRSVQRILNTGEDTAEQLTLLDARLGAAVARAAELALTTDTAGLTALDGDLHRLVDELGALRSALTSLS